MSQPTSNQDGANRQSDGRFGPGNNANPTGHGGLGDHPENRSSGKWNKENSISYQYKKFLSMPITEFTRYLAQEKDGMTMTEKLAYYRIKATETSLRDMKEITDRTEGRVTQAAETDDQSGRPIITGFVLPSLPETVLKELDAIQSEYDKEVGSSQHHPAYNQP